MRTQRGFTLIEVMISLLIFSVVLGGMAPAFVSQLKSNSRSQIRTEAIAVSQQVMDSLRLQNPSTLPVSGSSSPEIITFGNRSYSAVAFYCEATAYCTTANNRHITVRVSHNNVQVFETQSVYTQLR